MKKSYVQENTLQVKVTIDLGEINSLINELDAVASAEGSNNWKARDLVASLKKLRRDAAEEAKTEFERMMVSD